MKEEQIKLLESRINKAITFIENLKSREKKLILEKVDLNQKIFSLENNFEEKENKIKELKESQEFLREKIEVILGKLESFASMETDIQLEPSEVTEKEEIELEKEYEPAVPDNEEVIVEESIADLQENNVEEESLLISTEELMPQNEDTEEIKSNELVDTDAASEDVTEKDENSLFNNDLGLNNEELSKTDDVTNEDGSNSVDLKTKWLDNNPFIET